MSDLLIKVPTEYEPLQTNRFIARFPSDLGIQEWWVQSFAIPKFSNTSVEIPFLNTSNYVIGKYKWEAFNASFMCPVGPSAMVAIMEWVRLHSESATGRQGYAVSYKRDVMLELLDPTGTAISEWLMKECMITAVDFGSLSYQDNGKLINVSLTLQPYYALLLF